MKKEENGKETGLSRDVAKKLEARFGLGSQPETRRTLYKRLELAVEVHGERAWIALRTVAAEAAGARKPDRYFCRSALCRLREQGLMPLADL
jgi:hypothetical protein